MTPVIVRRLDSSSDLSQAIHLLQRFFREEGFDTADETIASHARQLAALDSCGLFAAMQQDATIGVATVSLEFGIEYGWSAEMGDLYVIPEMRGKGISRQLLAAVETYLRHKGAGGYQVTVTPFAEEHHAMAKFYQRLGFDNEGRLILYKKLQ